MASHALNLLPGRVALVTGGTRGIGRAIAETFAANGAHVVVTGTHPGPAQEVADLIQRRGWPDALGLPLDVRDPVQIEHVFTTTMVRFGRIDILVNNAGVHTGYPVAEFPLEAWRDLYRINVEGVFLCSQAAMRAMMAHGAGGVILHMSSAAARASGTKQAAYASSKAALLAFSRVLAVEGGPYGIRSNCILPGATETDMLEGVFATIPGIREELLGRTVLGKLGNVQDQANVALFLASDLGRHVTGEYVVVSGGEFMNA